MSERPSRPARRNDARSSSLSRRSDSRPADDRKRKPRPTERTDRRGSVARRDEEDDSRDSEEKRTRRIAGRNESRPGGRGEGLPGGRGEGRPGGRGDGRPSGRNDDRRRSYRDDDRRTSDRSDRSGGRSFRGEGRPGGRGEGRPGGRGDDKRRSYRDDDRPQTAARRRSQEVKDRTGGRRTQLEMSSAPVRSKEEWIDEGSVRPNRGAPHKPTGARARTSAKPARGGRRQVRAMDSVIEEIERAVGAKAASRVVRRYEAALASFEAHRYSEARVVLVPLARECSDVAAIRELLGLCYYREANWKKAVEHLEASLAINPKWIFNHAVLADCHRALGNYDRIEQLWEEISEASPHPELLAEARIVYAMSIADQGDPAKALTIMVKILTQPKRINEYHLRQWYVVADLYDRLGNIIKAREVFDKISDIDPSFADVAERLSVLGA